MAFTEVTTENIKPNIQNGIVFVTKEQQRTLWLGARRKCLTALAQGPSFLNGTFCNRTWDNIMCWPDTPAGSAAVQGCANYIHGFNIHENATRICRDDGTWYVHPGINTTWTNYSLCQGKVHREQVSLAVKAHLPRVVLMYTIGYGLSLMTLVVALAILLGFKKLRCPRNTIHVNLFLAFIFRAILSFIRDSLMVDGVGFKNDMIQAADGRVIFNPEGTHWQCKLFSTVYYYVVAASVMWVFVEGLYLHTLLFARVFTERSSARLYVLFGWASPILFVLPWAIVRATLEDTLCWNTHETEGYLWIITGPLSVAFLINFVFFIIIVWVLFTKLKAPGVERDQNNRYGRLAKSTLVLVPLFGVHYFFMMFLPDNVSDDLSIVKLYFDMFFNSFQGFIVSLLVCFMNGEVRSEIKKKWYRIRFTRRRGREPRTSTSSFTSYLSRARGSQEKTPSPRGMNGHSPNRFAWRSEKKTSPVYGPRRNIKHARLPADDVAMATSDSHQNIMSFNNSF